MGDYIRGKKAYTKWDADSDNIDIEYRPEAQKTTQQEGWLSGTKGRVIKVLLILLVFSIGLILGYLLRRGVHEVIFRHQPVVTEETEPFAYLQQNRILLQEAIKTDSIREFLKNYTVEPHIAGKPSSKKLVSEIVRLWKSWGLDTVRREKFKVLLSYPSSNSANKVHIVNKKDNNTMRMASESGDDELHSDLRPYMAYSPNKSAEGKLVYANYGQQEDFVYLLNQNVTVNGSIVIIRLGKIHRANKVKNAETFLAAGVLLYPDPSDFVNKSSIYPLGLGLPGDSVIRGSLNLSPGDPATPFQPSTDDAYRLPASHLQLPKIPVQPISYNNALKFMIGMAGPEAPTSWRGGLNISYNLGPGHIKPNDSFVVTLNIFNELKEKEIFNVIGIIKGRFEPDRYVILGNHFDSWTNGSGDPGTGLAAFMEVVKAFGELKKGGWLPGRTIIFACWDAEEFGMIGSTEWVQKHEKELASRAVAYINTDSALVGKDVLFALGSPLLQQTLQEAAKEISYPYHGQAKHDLTVFDVWKMHSNDSKSIPRLKILGSGSDFVSFMSTHGISSMHIQFIARDVDLDYPLYHSAYDNFEAVAKFVDSDFEISQTLARLVATLALKLSDSLRLPMSPQDYGLEVNHCFSIFRQTYEADLKERNVSLDKLADAVTEFLEASKHFHNNFSSVNPDDELLAYHEYNDRAIELERSFILPHWNSHKLSYKHTLFGPNPSNLNEGIAFPQLVDAILQAQTASNASMWEFVSYEISQAIHALGSASSVLSNNLLTDKDINEAELN